MKIHNKIAKFYFLLIISMVSARAQNLYPSAVTIETQIYKKIINGKNLSALLQVNETTSEIALRIDAAKIITGTNAIDSILSNLENGIIFLKGNFPIKDLSFVDNNNEEQREFSGKAQLTMNGITREQNYTCDVFNLNGNDGFSQNNIAYPLNINLYFEFQPGDFKLNTVYTPLVNGIKVEVAKGLINRLTSGSQNLFNTK